MFKSLVHIKTMIMGMIGKTQKIYPKAWEMEEESKQAVYMNINS